MSSNSPRPVARPVLAVVASLASLFGSLPSAAKAADIVKMDTGDLSAELQSFDGKGRPALWLKLTGIIVKGDADRLEKVIKENAPQGRQTGRIRLLLDSPGGSYAEALKIADRFRLTTVVDAGATCLSACAVLFMAGRIEDGEADRHMHASARLGFHAPYILPPEGTFSRETLTRAYKLGLEASVALLERQKAFTLTDLWIDSMLRKGPKEFAEVTYVHHAIEYAIAVFGVRKPSIDPRIMVTHLCLNRIDPYQRPDAYDGVFDRRGRVKRDVAQRSMQYVQSMVRAVRKSGRRYILKAVTDEMAGTECTAILTVRGRSLAPKLMPEDKLYRGKDAAFYLLYSRWDSLPKIATQAAKAPAAGSASRARDEPDGSDIAKALIGEVVKEACGGSAGKIDDKSIILRDLTGDRRPDLVINHADIHCDREGLGMQSDFCGQGGSCSIQVYVRQGDRFKAALDWLGGSIRIGRGRRPRLSLSGHQTGRARFRWKSGRFRQLRR